MPVNAKISNDVWARFQYLRENGHRNFIEKAKKCDDFFAGIQWDPRDVALLRATRRPYLTINQIISTVSNVLGEQIFNRSEISFRPRNEGATAEVADALTKVYMQISDNNQLSWLRSDVFCDGVITGRGFYDVRLDFTDSLRGEVRITQLNPRNVMPDCDADQYDPDTWSDVTVSKWMSADEIELLYSKADADLLRARQNGGYATYSPYSVDAFDDRQTFSNNSDVPTPGWSGDNDYSLKRSIRVIERQYRKLAKVNHFVSIETGDTREIPESWDEARIAEYMAKNPNTAIVKKLIPRIRWVVVADNIVLHDDWSPYKRFTVVPYFPYFRRGRTIGLVENLLGPQELLNKVSSQELHVVNTTANSGWKVKTNSLRNMSVAELEQRGAETGLVIEVDEMDAVDKIQPNQIPSGLDRISYKAEEHIKTISGVSDYQTGFAREDVSAKSVQANKASGATNTAKIMDNLNRTDFMLARNILDIIQEYYTEPRLITITTDRLAGTTESMRVNEITPEGVILNDLTLGEYAVVTTSQPERDTFEDTQFDQALSLRMDAGIPIPDRFLIQSSKLRDKAAIVQAMEGDKDSPEAQEAAELERRSRIADVQTKEADAQSKSANAQLSMAKAKKENIEADQAASGAQDQAELAKVRGELELKQMEVRAKIELQREELQAKIQLQREEAALKMQLQQQESAAKIANERAMAAIQARTMQDQAANKAAAQTKPTKNGASE